MPDEFNEEFLPPVTDLFFLSGEPGVMPTFHRHKEVEMNWVASGEMTYLFGGARRVVGPGRLTVFWAALPHRVTHLAPGTQFYCVHLPLTLVLRWRLPGGLTERLLGGEMVQEPEAVGSDKLLFEQWRADMADPAPEARHNVHLELEARLCRLARRLAPAGPSVALPADARTVGKVEEVSKVEEMAAWMGEQYAEGITAADVARAAGLHPKYAMALFRRCCGMTLGDYLTQQRLSQAQRLLVTTDMKIIDVAFAAGFGSVSRFYEAFTRACGQSPRTYRAGLNGH